MTGNGSHTTYKDGDDWGDGAFMALFYPLYFGNHQKLHILSVNTGGDGWTSPSPKGKCNIMEQMFVGM